MKGSSQEVVTHFKCPSHVARALEIAGGTNPFGEPIFRCVWGYDRIVPVHGQWEEWETVLCTLTDKVTGIQESRPATRLKSSIIETRMVPKYLPGNCWHLEMWRPAEEYGSPEEWGKIGQEIVQGMTINVAGPYPERGEYELCYPLTSDATSHGLPIPLVESVVEEIANMIRVSRDQFNFQQRKAAIEQREARREDGLVRRMEDILRDGLPSFHGETFVTVPKVILTD